MLSQILTPTGYVPIGSLRAGDAVLAYDGGSGALLTNHLTIDPQLVDDKEWSRWWQGPDLIEPPFMFYRITGSNGKIWTLNSEQSIWRNGTSVCHAKHLVVGDTLYDDYDQPLTITAIESVGDLSWYRLEVDGDHSYIADGLTLHNASRFWVGGAGTWDLSTTTHWAASTGGAGGQTAPGAADAVTIDGSSGAGTITPSFGGTGSFQSITCGAMGMTLDFSVNNNSVTLSSNFSGTGTGTRTINLGNGTWTMSDTALTTVWTFATITGLTFSANSSTISFTGNTANLRSVNWGASLTYNTVTISGNPSGGDISFASSATFANFTVTGPNNLSFGNASTITITNAFTWTGASGSYIGFVPSSAGNLSTISCASGTCTISWGAIHNTTFSGGATFTASNSFDLGHNSGITITPPSGGGSSGVIGG